METGFPEGSYTLTAMVDGNTSLYFSNGGGIIGGGGHDSVRNAARNLLLTAQHVYTKAQAVTNFPKPKVGYVIFYFRTFAGVRSYTALEEDLGNERDELSTLFFAAHTVITELLKIDQKMPHTDE